MIDYLLEIIQIETPSRDPKHLPELFTKLEEDFAELGFQTRRIPGVDTGDHLYARPNRSDRNHHQLILGHADTVWPIGTLSDNPARVGNSKIKGPGAYDMKAGLTTIIFTLKILSELNHTPELTPLILINSDEETGSPDSIRLIKRLARVSERVFVMEPSGPDNEVRIARKGSAHYDVQIEGRASHAGIEPEEGANAIHAMSEIVRELREFGQQLEDGTVNVGTIDGGVGGNVVAPDCRIEVDARAIDAEMVEKIDNRINSLESPIAGTSIDISGGFRQPPMERKGNVKLWEVADSIAKELGLELREEPSGGASDGNTASQYATTIDGLGPSGDGAHQQNEYVKVDSIPERIALLAGLLMQPSINF